MFHFRSMYRHHFSIKKFLKRIVAPIIFCWDHMSINTTILNEISAIFPPIFLPIYSKLYQSNTNWPANNATTRYFAKEEKNNLIIGQQWRLAQSSNYRHVGRWATLISSSSENWETGLSSLKKKTRETGGKMALGMWWRFVWRLTSW